MESDIFEFRKYFKQFENNSKYQKQIINILKSNDDFSFEWINDEDLQRKGIDLILEKDFSYTYIDIKGVSQKYENFYLKNIPIELISNTSKFINTKANKGRSWLYKADSKTHYLIYYWVDKQDNVKNSLIQIDYLNLRKFAETYFPIKTLYKFLNINNFKKRVIGYLNGYKIYSARNDGYFTINTPIDLSILRKFFFKKCNKSKIGKIILKKKEYSPKPLNKKESTIEELFI